MISHGQISDLFRLDELIHLAQSSHAESRFSYIEFSEKKAEEVIKKAVANPGRHAILYAERKERLVGALYCSVGEYYIGNGALLTTVHNVNVLPQVRRSLGGGIAALKLMKGAELWSRSRNAREILFHVTSGVQILATDKLLGKLNFELIGGSYSKRISPSD